MLLGKFKYNDKEYVLKLNNEHIEYGYIDNNNINMNLTLEERTMMDYVLSKITISKNKQKHVKCGEIIYNHKQFQIMFDKISERKFFYEINNNNYLTPSDEDNLYLINKYNPVILYSGFKMDDSVKKMIIRINCELIVIFVSLIALKTFDTTPLLYNISTNINQYMDYLDEDFSYNEIKEAINNNKNLTIEEKEFIINHSDVIIENSQYISMRTIKNNLTDLDIKYSSVMKEAPNVLGSNDETNKLITIYGAQDYNSAMKLPFGEQTLLHELIHSYSRPTNLGNGLSEAVTEVMSCEYLDFPISISYTNERSCLYALIELIGIENIKEFYFKGDATIIVDSLKQIINDENMAYELIGNIDSINQYEENVIKSNYDIKAINQYAELKNEIYNKISKYFEIKYNYDISDDELMMAYLVNNDFTTLEIDSPYVSKEKKYISKKGLFSSEFIKSHQNTYYRDSEGNVVIISDRNIKTK